MPHDGHRSRVETVAASVRCGLERGRRDWASKRRLALEGLVGNEFWADPGSARALLRPGVSQGRRAQCVAIAASSASARAIAASMTAYSAWSTA